MFSRYRRTILILLTMAGRLCSAGPGADSTEQIAVSSDSEPAYKVLYESGFYSQAIELLEAAVQKNSDSVSDEQLTYLAYSYIAAGQSDKAQQTFMSVLRRNPAFMLDPVLTAPKIYNIYRQARAQWAREQAAQDSLAAARERAKADPAASADVAATDITKPSSEPAAPPEPKQNAWLRTSVCFLPAGTGQFYQKKIIRGVILGSLQAVALAGSISAYYWRDRYYDSRYGWYEINRPKYDLYTNAYRIGFGVFISGYIYGIIDALVSKRRTTAAAQ